MKKLFALTNEICDTKLWEKVFIMKVFFWSPNAMEGMQYDRYRKKYILSSAEEKKTHTGRIPSGLTQIPTCNFFCQLLMTVHRYKTNFRLFLFWNHLIHLVSTSMKVSFSFLFLVTFLAQMQFEMCEKRNLVNGLIKLGQKLLELVFANKKKIKFKTFQIFFIRSSFSYNCLKMLFPNGEHVFVMQW